jgi:hypothetical protein
MREKTIVRPSAVGRAVVIAVLGIRVAASACDVCAVYTATEMSERRTGVRVGVAEQFTRFGTLQDDGREVSNPARERVDSSITQLFAGYNPTPRLGLQLTLPLIQRNFRRLQEGGVSEGDESGAGDLALTASVLAYSTVSERSVFRFSLLGGIEFPTGDSSRLSEELEETQAHAAALRAARPAVRPRHTTGGGGTTGGGEEEVATGVHGHDLALGSGSYDGIVGGQLFWSFERLYLSVAGQYAIRSEGDFDYRYANDLTWSGGPGVFVLLTHAYTLGLQALVAGETKGKDRQQGQPLDDTGITALYAGPALSFTWGTSLAIDAAGELPAIQNNTSLQIVPDYRIRGGITWRF